MTDVKTKRAQTSHLPISVYNAKGGGVRLRTLSKGTPPALAVTHSLGYIAITSMMRETRAPSHVSLARVSQARL